MPFIKSNAWKLSINTIYKITLINKNCWIVSLHKIQLCRRQFNLKIWMYFRNFWSVQWVLLLSSHRDEKHRHDSLHCHYDWHFCRQVHLHFHHQEPFWQEWWVLLLFHQRCINNECASVPSGTSPDAGQQQSSLLVLPWKNARYHFKRAIKSAVPGQG